MQQPRAWTLLPTVPFSFSLRPFHACEAERPIGPWRDDEYCLSLKFFAISFRILSKELFEFQTELGPTARECQAFRAQPPRLPLRVLLHQRIGRLPDSIQPSAALDGRWLERQPQHGPKF